MRFAAVTVALGPNADWSTHTVVFSCILPRFSSTTHSVSRDQLMMSCEAFGCRRKSLRILRSRCCLESDPHAEQPMVGAAMPAVKGACSEACHWLSAVFLVLSRSGATLALIYGVDVPGGKQRCTITWSLRRAS